MNFDTLQAQYDTGDRFVRAAVVKALRSLQRTTQLPAWAAKLVPPQAPTPSAPVAPPAPMTAPLARAIAAAKAQRALTPSAFGTVNDAALDRALLLDPIMHRAAEAAIGRLTIAARALRPIGTESAAHADWAALAAAIAPAIERAKAKSGQPGTGEIVGALYSTLPREPSFDDGGAATVADHATALGAVRVLLDV